MHLDQKLHVDKVVTNGGSTQTSYFQECPVIRIHMLTTFSLHRSTQIDVLYRLVIDDVV